MASTDGKANVSGKAGNDDLRATNDTDGTLINAGAGDDILRGGRFDDILVGGSGNDQMFGGDGADQFRFFGNQIDGAGDLDKIFDLDFSEGDTLVFGSFAAGTFSDDDGVNAFADDGSAIVSSFEGLANIVNGTTVTAEQRGNTDTLILRITNDAGQVQEIHISNAYAAFVAASSDTTPL